MATVDCSANLIDEITKALDEESYAISIFLDLSGAFDRVNSSILLSKLGVYGIQVIENQLLRSYFMKRKQKVFVNGIESDFMEVNSGVPQGSILGLVLFLVYVNDIDIVIATNYFSIRLFANDTSLTVTGKDLHIDFLLQQINSGWPAKGFVQIR